MFKKRAFLSPKNKSWPQARQFCKKRCISLEIPDFVVFVCVVCICNGLVVNLSLVGYVHVHGFHVFCIGFVLKLSLCIDLGVYLCIDLCIGLCIDLCTGLCTDLCSCV